MRAEEANVIPSPVLIADDNSVCTTCYLSGHAFSLSPFLAWRLRWLRMWAGVEAGCQTRNWDWLSSQSVFRDPPSSSHLLPINLRKRFKNPLLCPEFGGWGQRGRERICRDKPCSGKKTLLPKIKIWEVSWELRLGENTLGKAVAFTRHFTAGHLNASRFRFLFLSNESPGLTRQPTSSR